MIFLKREKLENFIKEYCALNNVMPTPFNVITTMDQMRFVNTENTDKFLDILDSENAISEMKEYMQLLPDDESNIREEIYLDDIEKIKYAKSLPPK